MYSPPEREDYKGTPKNDIIRRRPCNFIIKTTREHTVIRIEVYEHAPFRLVAYHKKLDTTVDFYFLISRGVSRVSLFVDY